MKSDIQIRCTHAKLFAGRNILEISLRVKGNEELISIPTNVSFHFISCSMEKHLKMSNAVKID